MMRCLRLALLGFVSGFVAWPAPYFRDRDCWMRGKEVAFFFVVAAVVGSIFGAGFFLARVWIDSL